MKNDNNVNIKLTSDNNENKQFIEPQTRLCNWRDRFRAFASFYQDTSRTLYAFAFSISYSNHLVICFQAFYGQ